jgi:hypothetical protein
MIAEDICWTTAAADCSRSDVPERYTRAFRAPALIQKHGALTQN